MREQIGRIEQQLREANNKAALCEQRSEEAEASRRDAAQRADEAERSLLQAVSQGVALQEEVRGSSVKHSIIRSFIQPFIHSFVRSDIWHSFEVIDSSSQSTLYTPSIPLTNSPYFPYNFLRLSGCEFRTSARCRRRGGGSLSSYGRQRKATDRRRDSTKGGYSNRSESRQTRTHAQTNE